jgi:hypothetical protein
MAATKDKKHRNATMLKGRLTDESTLLVAGFRCQGLSVKKMIEFRRASRSLLRVPTCCW